ncbi:hypothetical protein NP493_776g01007 [Ridgeia piscesae]|uniref:Uncharacterized protein n=1 Tax=Ridgeia piscesae TaxID=27915 RepID=A0AAD9NND5_RIDPI|nr:hypothetical protein NP493_776g01007 [Ridgeia piscesae]
MQPHMAADTGTQGSMHWYCHQTARRVIKKLQAKDTRQVELERKEQGFSLYVNGAHSNHSKKTWRSPPGTYRTAKTAGEAHV